MRERQVNRMCGDMFTLNYINPEQNEPSYICVMAMLMPNIECAIGTKGDLKSNTQSTLTAAQPIHQNRI